MSKVLLSYYELTEEQQDTVKKLDSDIEIISSLGEAANLSDINIIYGWDKEECPQLLEDDDSQVQWIQLNSAGVDYVDLELLEKKGIQLTSAVGIHANAISESIFGLLLNYTRGIGYSFKKQLEGIWDKDVPHIRELTNKTIVIVGAGHIGTQTAKRAKAFDMKTIGINRSGRSVDFMDEQFTQEDFEKALPKADVVVNILPSTDETQNLFNLDLFKKMKESAIFINVGRGTTVVEKDLLTALEDGLIEFAALDVFEEEPLPSDHPFYQREDMLLTPHIAGNLDDYAASLFPIFEENLEAFSKGEDLTVNVVDLKSGY